MYIYKCLCVYISVSVYNRRCTYGYVLTVSVLITLSVYTVCKKTVHMFDTFLFPVFPCGQVSCALK